MKDARFILQGTERPSVPASEIFLDKPITVNGTEFVRGTSLESLVANMDTRPYKVYSALLSQTGTSAPVVTVLENTLGDIVWTRSNTGIYNATLTSAFPTNKTTVTYTIATDDFEKIMNHLHISTNVIQFYTAVTSAGSADGVLGDPAFLEIRIYN